MKKLYFSVDSALLGELGERLVEKSYIALAELVKNAYDADATSVRLEFVSKTKNSKDIKEIRVTDNGSGMDMETVRKYWMRIATTIKQRAKVSSRYGRPRTGSKGIGRFACRRLGRHLKLETIGIAKNGKYYKINAEFKWSRFKPGLSVTKIPVGVSAEQIHHKRTGTTLVISDIPSKWTQRDFDVLRRNLVTLAANVEIKRDGFEEDPGFNIKLQAPIFEGGIGNIRDQLLNASWGTLTGQVKSNGGVVYNLKAKKIGNKKYIYKHFAELIPNIKFKIGIMPLVKAHMRDIKVASKKNLILIAKEWGGIYVRYNDFRVYPYGEQGDDWLEIDRDRGRRLAKPENEEIFSLAKRVKGIDPSRVLLNTLSSNQYFGYVDIYSTKTKGFIIKANREGFIDSKEVKQLKKFVRDGIHWATIYYNHYLYRLRKEKAMVAIADLLPEDALGMASMREKAEKAISVLENSVQLVIDSIPTDKRKEIEEPLMKSTKVIHTICNLNHEELSQMRLMASANPVLFAFSHEVRILIGNLNTHFNELKRISSKVPTKYRNEFLKFTQNLRDTASRFADLMTMIGLLVGRGTEKPVERLTLKPRIIKAAECMKLIIDYFNIKVIHDQVPDNIQVGPIREPELFSVLVNILSNSVKAVVASNNKRKIKFEIARDNKALRLHVLDTGIGLSKKYWEEVFTPLIADPEGKLYSRLSKNLGVEDFSVLGRGSGLGLNIIRQIMRERGGDVYFTSPPKSWSTCIEVRFK